MPTYQYSCTECGHFFEQVQSFTEDSLTVCPECQGRLRKVFNAVGVVFKGSGFYRTDSRSGSGSGGDSSGGSDSGSGSGSGESTSGEKKTETKAAKPAETPKSSGSTGSSGSSGSSTAGAGVG